jgi:hypothetical protein
MNRTNVIKETIMSLAVQNNGSPQFDDEVFAVLALDAALVAMSVLIYTQPASAHPVDPIALDLPHEQVENVTVVPDSIAQEQGLESSVAADLGEVQPTVDCVTYTQYLSREDCSTGDPVLYLPEHPLYSNFDRPYTVCDRPNHLETTILGVCLPLQ